MVFTVKCNIKSDNSGFKQVLNACRELKKKIKVGYLSNDELAYRATVNHNGGTGILDDGSKIEIPPRPFIEHAMTEFKGSILSAGDSYIEKEFTPKTIKDKMRAVAKTGRDTIIISIDDVREWCKFPENSPRTIELKGSDHPLIDTGAMRNGVEYEIGEE